VQVASEGVIHGTSSRKESDDALGCIVIQRAANGNDREECSQLLCLRLGESIMPIDGVKYTIEWCIPAYLQW
jgi:hypothetical protein